MVDKFASDRYCNYLYILPILTFAFVPGCFVITYTIAVAKDHVHPMLPMISETGEELPENFVFASIVNIGAAFGTVNYVARYFVLSRWSHQKPSMDDRRRSKFSSLNRTSLVVALFGVVGAVIVGNVEANRHLYLHNTGALLVVVMSIAYAWMHTLLSFSAPIVQWPKHVRAVIAFVCTVSFIAGASAVPYAHGVTDLGPITAWQRNDSIVETARFIGYRWVSENHEYFNALLFYHITEWVIVLLFGLFLLSFAVEFRLVRIQIPRVHFTVTPADVDPSRGLQPRDDRSNSAVASCHSRNNSVDPSASAVAALANTAEQPRQHHVRSSVDEEMVRLTRPTATASTMLEDIDDDEYVDTPYGSARDDDTVWANVL